MEDRRQEAFQKLRPACVDLSSAALKFRGKQNTVKNVSQTLDAFLTVLRDPAVAQNLNEKLAEYAFFPLTHIFNESQRLSSRCLELAVLSLQILVAKGWREKLAPEMGNQLLILLTLLGGGSPGKNQAEPPSEDLKVAAFDCIGTVVTWLGASPKSKSTFNDVSSRNVVDQLVFLLLTAISDDASDKVQLAASEALLHLSEQITSVLFLASLLPRTVSTLTKVLRPSTQQRRTYKVLQANLNLLQQTLMRVLNDQVSLVSSKMENANATIERVASKDQSETLTALDESWLKATSSQVKIALTNVVQLRLHDHVQVREALAQLCMMVLEECSRSLPECAAVMLETLVFLAHDDDSNRMSSSLKFVLTTKPFLIDDLRASLQRWLTSLPRLMQSNDDRPRRRVLMQISQAITILSSMGLASSTTLHSLPTTLIDSVVGAIRPQSSQAIRILSDPPTVISQILSKWPQNIRNEFQSLVIGSKSQQAALIELEGMVRDLGSLEQTSSITRAVVDSIPTSEGDHQISAIWLALKLLEKMSSDIADDFIVESHIPRDLNITKPFLISDLYSYSLPLLVEDSESGPNLDREWQAQALALECLVLQARQLGKSYRPELIDSLYPTLSFLGSRNDSLQQHAMTALNQLAYACQYSSVTDMLVDNVDYLVNSIALKLNSSNLAPQAPQVLLMMVRLCGVRLIPYLDDLIGSIFVALDDFHGYPQLVELLFEVLSAIVDEGAKQPVLAITEGKETPKHRKTMHRSSGLDDILGDVRARRSRKRRLEEVDDEQNSVPQRPWSDELDGPRRKKSLPADTNLEENTQDESMPVTSSTNEEKPLAKAHQLLLSIGQATTPHLTSPSPKVRHTLLNLLDRIAPLLARDENSFLPLINSIWPSLIERLFGEVIADGDGESAFNVCAAANTISRLCEGAGDFMASRIEDIFPQLKSLWNKTWSKVEADRVRSSAKSTKIAEGKNLAGSVDLNLVKPHFGEVESMTKSAAHLSIHHRTTDAQILNALITLLTSILSYVRVSEDNGDAILKMVAPVLDVASREI